MDTRKVAATQEIRQIEVERVQLYSHIKEMGFDAATLEKTRLASNEIIRNSRVAKNDAKISKYNREIATSQRSLSKTIEEIGKTTDSIEEMTAHAKEINAQTKKLRQQ